MTSSRYTTDWSCALHANALISKTAWILRRGLREVWVRVVAFAILALVTAALAQWLGPLIPESWLATMGADAVDQVLGILASSMLAVTTFSLSIAVSAFSAAAMSATPRATELLQKDNTTQNVLATFLGAFLFSLVGIIALTAGFYDNAGRLLLFAVTVLVVGLVVAALIRWISHLMRFGRMGDTLDRVEAAATESLRRHLEHPYLKGRPADAPQPPTARAVYADTVGYVQHIDVAALSDCAKELNGRIWIAALPGSFVHRGAPLAWIDEPASAPDQLASLRAAFSCAHDRTFDQDPRFGMIVLAEIASRALSPALNDPGTAISVIGRIVRVLSIWQLPAELDIEHDNVFVPPVLAEEMIEDGLRPIARDGAGIVEVQIRLQKALRALAASAPESLTQAVEALSAEALHYARAALPLDTEIARVEQLAAPLQTGSAPAPD